MKNSAKERAFCELELATKNANPAQVKTWRKLFDAMEAGRDDRLHYEKSIAEHLAAWSAEVNFDATVWQNASIELEEITAHKLEIEQWDERTAARERKIFEVLKICAKSGTLSILHYPNAKTIGIAADKAAGNYSNSAPRSPKIFSVANYIKFGGLPYNSPRIRALGAYTLEPAGCKFGPGSELGPGSKFKPGCRFDPASKFEPSRDNAYDPFCELDPECKPPRLRAPYWVAELILE